MDKAGNASRELCKRIADAIQGWHLWRKILRKCKAENSIVMFFPSSDHRCNYHALQYMGQLLEQTGSSSVIIASVDPSVIVSSKVFSNKIKETMQLSQRQVEKLLRYYSVEPFDRRLIVCSLNEPYGRDTDKLIGVNGTTVGEIMTYGVFGLAKYVKEPAPVYKGNDPTILKFIDTKEFHKNES